VVEKVLDYGNLLMEERRGKIFLIMRVYLVVFGELVVYPSHL